jgi:hypothetical protein
LWIKEVKEMKKLLCAVLVLALFATFLLWYDDSTKYEKEVEVIKSENGEVFVKDNLGNEWSFYGKGYKAGRKIVVVFDSKETPRIYDDEIVGVA